MSRLVIFKAADTSAPGWEDRTFPGGGLSDILGQQHDFSGGAAPEEGYRLLEFKRDEATATGDHHGGATHQREAPWRVSRVEEYVANTGMEEFSEVVVAYCDYSPLPEEENPWVELEPAAAVSLDSFAGDVEAFEEWKRSQEVMAR